MTADEGYEYFAKVRPSQPVDRPSTLWRRRDGRLEYLSLLDWDWHEPDDQLLLPDPSTLEPVTAEHAAVLLADRQRFVQYWVEQNTGDRPPSVFRRRRSPERLTDEVFGLRNRWVPTTSIREFLSRGPDLGSDLVRADLATAERVLEETRGVAGATEL